MIRNTPSKTLVSCLSFSYIAVSLDRILMKHRLVKISAGIFFQVFETTASLLGTGPEPNFGKIASTNANGAINSTDSDLNSLRLNNATKYSRLVCSAYLAAAWCLHA